MLYGTTHGQTAKIASAIAETLRACDMNVDVVEANPNAPSPESYDAVLVAGSLHAGGFQRAVRRWAKCHAAALNERPTVFVSVCLGVLQQNPKVQSDLNAIIGRFFTSTGWHPTTTVTFAGALPYTRYNPLTRWIMTRIVSRAGGDTDTSRDYEYTDWAAVRTFARQFAECVRVNAAA